MWEAKTGIGLGWIVAVAVWELTVRIGFGTLHNCYLKQRFKHKKPRAGSKSGRRRFNVVTQRANANHQGYTEQIALVAHTERLLGE